MRTAFVLTFIVVGLLAADEDWGTEENGLRVALSVENEEVVVTMKNVCPGREMYLPLGRIVGVGRAEAVHLDLILPDGTRRRLEYTGGNGVAPGRLLPFNSLCR